MSHRIHSDKLEVYDHFFMDDYNFDQTALEILGPNDRIFKNGRGKNGIGDGFYDSSHKLLRQVWHQTQTKSGLDMRMGRRFFSTAELGLQRNYWAAHTGSTPFAIISDLGKKRKKVTCGKFTR